MRFLILLVLLFAAPALAQHPTNVAGSMIEVPAFAMADDSILGFNMGPLRTNFEPCYTGDCPANGYLIVNWNAYVPGPVASLDFLHAYFWYYDALGNRLDVKATLVPGPPFVSVADTLYITKLEFTGPDCYFDNGFSIDGWTLTFDAPGDAQVFGLANLYLSSYQKGWFEGNTLGSTFDYEEWQGDWLSYALEGAPTHRTFEVLPHPTVVPEPGTAAMLIAGVGLLAVVGKRR